MSVTVHAIGQRTPEWDALRLGRLTGSRAADMLSKIKSGEAAARRDYRIELVCERLTGVPQDDRFVSKDMQRGIELEPDAFVAYEALTGSLVRRTGFIAHDTLLIGCSLDGDVNDFEGVVELKAPKSATHLRYLLRGTVPSEYVPQITHNVWLTGAQWADFVSFDPRFPQALQLFVIRVPRAQLDLVGYEQAALAFLAEVERECQTVQTLANLAGQLQAALA